MEVEMVDLAGESLVLLRVRAGAVDKALAELKRNSKVRQAEPILGHYDIAVSGAFPNLEEISRFAQEMESKEFCEECTAYPAVDEWRKERPEERALMAWSLVRTSDAHRAKEELKRIPAVQRVVTTTGPFNLAVNLAIDDVAKLQETILKEIQAIHGVRRTETLPSVRTSTR
jgi:DNA-binding Lrp family transcriptional regulator